MHSIYTDGNILVRKPTMKMNSSTIDVQSTGIISSSQANIKAKNLGILFDIARKKIYTNKPLAVIREYCTNAYDAHVEAGIKDVPFQVSFPTAFKSTISIRDFGKGLSEAEMYGIFFEYAESTKRDTNDQVGMLGLGSKSAFCYADEYFVTSYNNGTKSVYHCYIDDTRLGTIAKHHEEPTTETGLQIDVEIKRDDIPVFRSVAGEFLSEFKPQPIIKNDDSVVNLMHREYVKNIVIENETYSIHRDWRDPNHVVRMGNVNYKFSLSDLNLSYDERVELESFKNNYVKIFAQIGDVTPSASREHLEMDDKTKQYIVEKLKHISTELTKDIQDKVDQCKSMYDFGICFERVRQQMYSFSVKIEFNDKIYSSSQEPRMRFKYYPQILVAEKYANYFKRKAFNKVVDFLPNEEQVFFTFHNNVSKHTVKQRILNSNYNLSNAFLLSFNDYASQEEFTNHPDWIGAKFIDVSTLPFSRVTKSRQSHVMVKSDVYQYNKYFYNKADAWDAESLSLADSSGVYVEINRFLPKFKTPERWISIDSMEDFKTLLNEFHSIEIDTPTIYGIKTSDIKKLGKGWISLEKYFEREIQNMTPAKIEAINSYKITNTLPNTWFDFYKMGMMASNENEEELKTLIQNHWKTQQQYSMKRANLTTLENRGYKFNFHIYDRVMTLVDETLNNHPVLRCLLGYSNTWQRPYYDYVNDYIMGK